MTASPPLTTPLTATARLRRLSKAASESNFVVTPPPPAPPVVSNELVRTTSVVGLPESEERNHRARNHNNTPAIKGSGKSTVCMVEAVFKIELTTEPSLTTYAPVRTIADGTFNIPITNNNVNENV